MLLIVCFFYMIYLFGWLDERILYYAPFYFFGVMCSPRKIADLLSHVNVLFTLLCAIAVLALFYQCASIECSNVLWGWFCSMIGTSFILLFAVILSKIHLLMPFFTFVSSASFFAYLLHRPIFETFAILNLIPKVSGWRVCFIIVICIIIISYYLQIGYNYILKKLKQNKCFLVKSLLLRISTPILVVCLEGMLYLTRIYFLIEPEELKKILKKNGFHIALCNHPSILFGHREPCEVPNSILALKWKIAYLKKCIRIGLLKTERGHALLQKLGIPLYYGNGVDFWFEESHSPIIPYTIPNGNCQVNRLAIYTALTGDYDNVQEVLYKEDGVDYILFTNNPNVKSKTWKVVLVESELDNVLLSREIKMLPHKYLGAEYDTSIYIDANAVIYGELSLLVTYLQGTKTFAVSKHGERNSVKDEVEAIGRQLKHINVDAARQQYQRYVADGFDDSVGLAECSILVRKHNDKKLQEVMEMWWSEFLNGIRRDQISLLPCIQRCNYTDYVLMNGYVRHNQFCKIGGHK